MTTTEKDLIAENERLRAENAALRERVTELEAELAKLKAELERLKGLLAEAERAGKRQAGAYLTVGGGRKAEQIIKPSVHPSEPQMEKMIEPVLAPTHANTLETLLDEPFAGTFYQSAADG